MIQVDDLRIQKEVLPLFDFTTNPYAKTTLHTLLLAPLSSVEKIRARQHILQGFIANAKLLSAYSYSKVNFAETYQFLDKFSFYQGSDSNFKVDLYLSQSYRHRARAKYIQLLLFFHSIQTRYISRLNLNVFSEEYKENLLEISTFLDRFESVKYEELIRKNKFSIKHIIRLNELIKSQREQGLVKIFWDNYFLFEAYLSISQGIIKNDFSFPVFMDNGLYFKELYHPLLKDPIKNSFEIKNNIVLLTGPNMSGKSTFLKSVGLSVYLGHVGLGVPATFAKMPYFDTLAIHLNHYDDIRSGYSHFMTEIINLKNVVVEARRQQKCFAVFDEIFNGTNVEDALQISSTTLQGFTKLKNSLFFVSTHLHQLIEIKSIPWEDFSLFYIDCELVDETPVFNYQLKEGWSELKIGQLLFEKQGLNTLFRANESGE